MNLPDGSAWSTTSCRTSPFDINAGVIDIADEDFGAFGIWTPARIREVRGQDSCGLPPQVCQTRGWGRASSCRGVFAMTCCVQDIQFVGFPLQVRRVKNACPAQLINSARGAVQFHPLFGGRAPVLTALKLGAAQPSRMTW